MKSHRLHFAAWWMWVAIISGSGIGTLEPPDVGCHKVAAAEVAPVKPSQTYRYLLLVDTSYSMHRCWITARYAVQDLIAGGFNEQIRPGDGFGVWVFNHDVYKFRYPFLNWVPDLNLALANSVGDLLKKERTENDTRLDLAIFEAAKAAQKSELLTIILISDEDTIKGTPFDAAINSYYREHKKDMHRRKLPFITSFLVAEGQFVNWTVSEGVGTISLPGVAELSPPVAEVMPKKPAIVATAPTVAPETKPNPVVPEKHLPAEEVKPLLVVQPKVAPATTVQPEAAAPKPKPIIEEPNPADTKPPVIAANAPPKAAEPPPSQPAPPPPTENKPPPAPKPEIIVNTPPPIVTTAQSSPAKITLPEETKAQPVPTQAAPIATPSRPETKSEPVAPTPVPVEVPPEAVAKNTIPEAVTPPVTEQIGTTNRPRAQAQLGSIAVQQPEARSAKYLVMGVAFLVIAGALVYFSMMGKRRPPGPSLISRSMDKDGP